MQCPQCQHENREGAKFCAGCGSSLAITCASCGNQSPPGAAFCDNCGVPLTAQTPSNSPVQSTTELEREPLSYTPQHLAEKILTSRSTLEGERKQVTVLFADIKDSTELIKDLDPEDAQKLLDPAIHIMMEAVHRFEGTVNQVLGDGIMALFGAPIAHEDHAARACYAALAMQTAMQPHADEVRRSRGITMQIRVGLNSGEVVVRTIGNDLHMDYSAVGPTTHLAARMEQIATPGSIVLSSETLRLVEGFVRVITLGPIPIKGMTDPVEVYELTGTSSIRRRLQAAVARGLTKFVGRDTEIDVLNQALKQAGSGHGQIVAAVGEAGVGKSRLVYEFVHSHRTHGWLVLESASVSYGKATPYFPMIDLLKRYVHVEEDDEPRTIRAKVTGQILTLDESLQETIPALLSLVDALPEDSPFLRLDPSQRRQRTLEGLKRILLRESQVQPLLLVFEDLHWIDSETQALLDSLVESLPTAHLLLLANYRPEYQHSWGSKTYYTQLRLDPLQAESAGAFLQALLGDDPGLSALKQLLIERTEGNPFFLEESVRTLVETEVLVGEAGSYRLARSLPSIQVPATVQAILAARIDRLPSEEKRLLQTAAVIGTEVPFPLLQGIAALSQEALHRGLAHLQTAEFIYETNLYPERQYTFKHALTHEVAYGSLLQEQRRTLHAQIVETLEALGGDQLAKHIEQLAHHAFRGEVWDKALAYYRQAGAKAVEYSAYQEAVVYFEQALQAIAHLPKKRETLEQAIDVRLELRKILYPLLKWEQALIHLREAEHLAEELGDQRRLGRVYYRLAFTMITRRDHDAALVYCQRTQAIATALGDVSLQVGAAFREGQVYLDLGDYQQAIACFRRNIASLQGELLYEFFDNLVLPSFQNRIHLVECLAEIGAFAESHAVGEESMRMAERLDRPYERVSVHCRMGLVHMRQGQMHKAIALLERGLSLAQEAEHQVLRYWVAYLLAVAYAQCGRVADALALVKQAVEQATSPRLLLLCIEAYLLSDHVDEASQLAIHTLERAQTLKQRGVEAGDLWLLGEIHMHRNPPEIKQAETHYQQALALADELGMRPLQAHCHRGLGTLYRQTGQPEQARAELATAIEMYRDMEMTFWLPETEAALTEVEGKA